MDGRSDYLTESNTVHDPTCAHTRRTLMLIASLIALSLSIVIGRHIARQRANQADIRRRLDEIGKWDLRA